MATYKSSPFYAVRTDGEIAITFDYFGSYETDNAEEIAVLDALVPTYIKRVDEPKQPDAPKKEQPKQDDSKPEGSAEKTEAPARKPARKSSAK